MNESGGELNNVITKEDTNSIPVEANIVGYSFSELISIFAIAIGLIIFIIYTGYGAIVRHQVEKRCNVETVANLVEDRREVYQYAPFHGGRVEYKDEYFLTYQFNINDTTYSIYKHSYDPNYPESIAIRYNPNDLTEYLYNNNEFIFGKEDAWVWVKDNQSKETVVDFE